MLHDGSIEFSGNMVFAVLLLFAAVPFMAVFIPIVAHGDVANLAMGIPFGAVGGAFALLAVWIRSCRVEIDSSGITYRSIFGERHIRWHEVERFYYRGIRQKVNFVPVGTFYSFKIVDSKGAKIRFGNRMSHCREIGEQLITLTYPPVYDKCMNRYTAGEELDFGAIRLSRNGGIRTKGLFGWRQMSLSEVNDYVIKSGYVYFFRVGQKPSSGPAVAKIANAFVLIGLLDAIYGRKAAAASVPN